MKKIIFLIWFLLISRTDANAQNSLSDDFLRKVKALNNHSMQFSLSMPIRDSFRDNVFWQIKYIILINDTSLQKSCSNLYVNKEVLSKLIELLDTDNQDWLGNMLLYHLTKSNAIELSVYLPENIVAWKKERKVKDKNIWLKYLSDIR